MNLDSATSSASPSNNPPHPRQARGSIAAQACETCRTRKQRCDEQRPKCGLCLRMNQACVYREPVPTKKDKTLVEILDRLRSLESKVDLLPTRASQAAGFGPAQPSPASQPSLSTDADDPSPFSVPPYRQSTRTSNTSVSGRSSQQQQQLQRHSPAAHKILTWPAIQQMLLHYLPPNIGDIKSLEPDGTSLVIRVSKGFPALALDEGLTETPFLGMQTQSTRATGGARVTFPILTQDLMLRLSSSYFNTFNLLYPFLDRQNFLSDTLAKVHSEGFNGDTDSIITLLVFALGEVAIEGSTGEPVDVENGRRSGVRGGDIVRPPGLRFFNEALKRIGFVLTGCELENVQIFSLAALYYESCSRHQDFWRLSVSASSACYTLITCNNIDWSSAKGDLIKRAFWHCAIMETGLHLELDLPPSGIVDLEYKIGVPSLGSSTYCEEDFRGNEFSHFEAHYASHIALRRLCADLHQGISESMSYADTPNSDDFALPSAGLLKQFAVQLQQWRGMLPEALQWPEDDPAAPPPSRSGSTAAFDSSLDPDLSSPQRYEDDLLFTTEQSSEPTYHKYVYDIQVALLRTRYYYAKYIVYRPFVYKALHFPDRMSPSDAQGAAECLRACLKWPLTLSPVSRKKRLVPYLFCWSQNFLGILLIFHMAEHSETLKHIRFTYCGPDFEDEYRQSIELMLDWIQDLKNSDPIALWCWKLLQGIGRIGPT